MSADQVVRVATDLVTVRGSRVAGAIAVLALHDVHLIEQAGRA